MIRTVCIALLVGVLPAACSEANLDGNFTDTFGSDANGSNTTPDGDDDDDDTDTTPPPETERSLLRSPAQTDIYVFVANPDRDTVTRVNVDTLAVDTTAVGSDPQIVLTTPDYATAVVFNRGDDTVSILDADLLIETTVEVRDNFNDMVLSPDGKFAVVWHNVAAEREDDPPAEGLQSFNEVSFVDLTTSLHSPMAVGFNPQMVRFTPDASLAVIVSSSYLALVDLTVTPLAPRLVELAPGVVDPPTAEEVIVAADGSFAWVRQFGASELLVVDLDDGGISPVNAGLNPTDLDLSPDGLAAVAVARGSAELWVYEANAPFSAPQVVSMPASSYGSLAFAPTGEQAVVYTTATLNETFGVWDVGSNAIEERSLVKPIQSVAITPTGETLLVFHTEEDGLETEPLFAGEWAITLVSLGDFRSNPLLLPAEPLGIANSTSGDKGYFAMVDEPLLEVLDYTTLLHEEIALRSLPVFLGVLPDLDPTDGNEPPAWVSQDHDLGRISFFDPDDASLETLTGFELNSEIEE
jgi:hypothetical protein